VKSTIHVLLFELHLDLSGTGYHVNCRSVFAETTLPFGHFLVKKVVVESVLNEITKDFACNAQVISGLNTLLQFDSTSFHYLVDTSWFTQTE
jgi:hypothetical protein